MVRESAPSGASLTACLFRVVRKHTSISSQKVADTGLSQFTCQDPLNAYWTTSTYLKQRPTLLFIMAFPNRLLALSTWRMLGLGLAASLASLGTWTFLTPLQPADTMGLAPRTENEKMMVSRLIYLLGSRDFCLAATLFWLERLGYTKAMGVFILAFTPTTIVDVVIAAMGPRGWDGRVWGLVGGGLGTMFVGLGLLQSN
jgi:hypothetical protein